MRKGISNEGFKRISKSIKAVPNEDLGSAPTMSIPTSQTPTVVQSAPPAGGGGFGGGELPPETQVPDSGNMLELFNMVKGALPADFLVEEMIRLLPPDEALTILEAIAEDNQVMPPKEVDPDSFGF